MKNYRVGWVTSIPITGEIPKRSLRGFPSHAQVKDRFTPGTMPVAADLKPVGQVELQGSWPRFQIGSSNGWEYGWEYGWDNYGWEYDNGITLKI